MDGERDGVVWPSSSSNATDDARFAEIVGPFYTDRSRAWEQARRKLTMTEGAVAAPVHKNALLLPPRRSQDIASVDGTYEGGVCSSDGSYLAGHVRKDADKRFSLTCWGAYRVEESAVAVRDEDVIFGGFIYKHFGHQLIESTSRLWYAVEHPEDTRRVVFLRIPADSIVEGDFQAILDLAGIEADRVEVVEKPTRFRSIVLPDQAFVIFDGADSRDKVVFEAMKERARGPVIDKVYLSKSKFARQDYVNERFLEEFYRARGFQVVYPETLPLSEQVFIVAHASEVATTIGTMSHLFLFARPDARLAIYLRSTSITGAQLLVDRLAGVQPAYVYVVRNLLPTRHTTKAHLFGPTRFFRKYLLDEGIAFTEEELRGYDPTGQDVIDYLCRYDRVSRLATAQREAAPWDMADVLVALREGLYDEPVQKKDYDEASIARKLRQRAAAAPAAEEADEGLAVPPFRLTWCKFADGSMEVHFKSGFLRECGTCRIVMIERKTGERRDIGQSAAVIEGDRASLTLDLAGFLDALAEPGDTRRWMLYVAAPGVVQPLTCEVGTRHFTSFTAWFLRQGDELLLPHCDDEGVLALWRVSARRLGYGGELFRYRPCRSLVNDLLLQLLRKGRWDDVAELERDFKAGAIACKPTGDKAVVFRGETYELGQFARQQAQLQRLDAWRNRPAVALCRRAVRRLRRAARRLIR